MKVRYSSIKTILLFVIILAATSYAIASEWPLKPNIDLSSGFGDFRGGRFHAGVDLRTGGQIGRKVFAPVSGYIKRIKMSYRGYGKVIYLKGDDGHIYLFAHLSKFIRPIGRAVRQAQNENQRYYIDIHLPPDSIKVKKGQFIARTGQSGVGAPHLHFEKRTVDNKPLNPMANGFKINDRVRPTFQRIGFQYFDKKSLFDSGKRRHFLPVKKGNKPGEFILTERLEFSGPFGILAHCFDQMRPGSMRQSIYRIDLFIDGEEVYHSQLDTLEFSIGSQVSLMFDPLEAAKNERRVRRLFLMPGESYRLGWSADENNGRVIPDDQKSGTQQAKIVATDNYGNKSQLTFEFIFKNNDKSEEDIAYDQIVDFEVVEDGLILSIADTINGLKGANSQGASSIGTSSQFVHISDSFSLAKVIKAIDSHDKKVFKVGNEKVEVLQFDSSLSIKTGSLNFFNPTLISVRKISPPDKNPDLISDVYHIEPDGFAVRKEFEISLSLKNGNAFNKRAGLCWWDKKEKVWVWIDEDTLNADLASAGSIGGGIFATLIDKIPPKIRNLNIRSNQIITNLQPVIKFNLTDSLSGFADDRSINVRIDGQWLIPEYDFEDNSCKAFLYKPLKPGAKVLTIKVKDRAGNITELKREFVVK